jgi:anti-anti-sigma factor
MSTVTSQYDAAARAIRFTFSGRMDTAASAAAADQVARELAACGAIPGQSLTVQFDLQAVDFVGSTFMRICIAAAKKGDRLAILNTSPMVAKTFKIAGLDQWLAS